MVTTHQVVVAQQQ